MKQLYVCVFSVILFFIIAIIIIIHRSSFSSFNQSHYPHDTILIDPIKLHFNDSTNWKQTCQFHTCFEINDCQFSRNDKISIYVYEHYSFKYEGDTYEAQLSSEYREILSTIKSSQYYEPDPMKACVFVPSIDLLNQQRINTTLVSYMLHVLPWWNNGRNHIIFSMLPGHYPSYNSTPDVLYGQAMVAGGGTDDTSYRVGYDISIPVYNGLTKTQYSGTQKRNNFLSVLVQPGVNNNLLQRLLAQYHGSNNREVTIMELCKHINNKCGLLPNRETSIQGYPNVLKESIFCLILPGYRNDGPDLLDIMMMGCIPVVLRNTHQVLPFSEVLDWSRACVFVWEEEIPQIDIILREVPQRVREEKRAQVLFLYNKYFSSIHSITTTTLQILNSRVFPLSAGTYESWNNQPLDSSVNDYFQYSYPLIPDLPPSHPKEGFTAIILAYNRVQMLFQTIASVSRAPSLAMIIVVWNNPLVDPPSESELPVIKKRIKIVQSTENKLSNRFRLYEEVHTSSILSLDDDITMLSVSEIEFGYRVWLEYPKQIVGYPGRVHSSSNGGGKYKWTYESEWMNNVSIVLTGAAFYHKYYHYLYTNKLPSFIKDWVDNHVNCEDILFNFMVSNYTRLPPIKVTSKKRFKCDNCAPNGLFTDTNHFNERNECINVFADYFGYMPLKTVKFRVDPVLFKVPNTDEFNEFPEIGQL